MKYWVVIFPYISPCVSLHRPSFFFILPWPRCFESGVAAGRPKKEGQRDEVLEYPKTEAKMGWLVLFLYVIHIYIYILCVKHVYIYIVKT